MPPLSIVLLQAVTVYCNNSITYQNLGPEFACLFDGTNHCVFTMIIALGFGWGGGGSDRKAKKSGGMVSPQHVTVATQYFTDSLLPHPLRLRHSWVLEVAPERSYCHIT